MSLESMTGIAGDFVFFDFFFTDLYFKSFSVISELKNSSGNVLKGSFQANKMTHMFTLILKPRRKC